MTLSFSKLNEIAHLYENAVHGEQEVLGEKVGTALDAANELDSQGRPIAAMGLRAKDARVKAQSAQTKVNIDPRIGAGGQLTLNKGYAATLGGQRGEVQYKSVSGKPGEVKKYFTPTKLPAPRSGRLDDPIAGTGPKGNEVGSRPRKPPVDAGAGSGAPDKPAAGASANPKVVPAKPAAPAKPAIPTGTTAGGTTFQRRAATGDELRAAQDARAAAKAAGNTKGAEEAAVKAGVNASKPATPSLSQRAAAMPAMGSSQFKPATASQATNAAGSNSAAASGSLVPKSNKIASSLKPIDLKASYEYDVYDLVLEYLLDNGHVDTVEEANYVMMEMDAETIGNIVEARMDPRGRPASGPMNVYRDPKGKPDQAHLDAIKSYDEKQKKKTPAQRQAELDAYIARQRNK